MPDKIIPPADTVESTLAQFSKAFTVSAVMTPREMLIGADTVEEGRQHSRRHGYDVIPHPSTGPITGFYYRGADITTLTPSDLVGDGTSLLDLLTLLAQREFFFVLRGNEISGYVHFSDLNKPLMRTPLYLLLEATERHLLTVLRQSLTVRDAEKALGPKRVKELQGYLKKATKKRADTSLWDVLGLRDILTIAIAHGLAHVSNTEQLADVEVEAMVEFRNGIAHGGLLLVEGHDSVASLTRLRQSFAQLRVLNTPRRSSSEGDSSG